jgi:hypothetical protein
MSDEFHRMLKHSAEQAEKNQWLNVLSALNKATHEALKQFDSVLKKNGI